MSKKKIALILLSIIFLSYAVWELLLPNDPLVNIYKMKYEDMSKPEYLQQLRDFCRYNLSDPIDNLSYSELVTWLHKYLTYTKQEFNRRDMPIDILADYVKHGVAFGRCGEFALCMNGLLLADGYKTRLIMDESKAVTQYTFSDTLTARDGVQYYEFPDQKVGIITSQKVLVDGNPYKEHVALNSSFVYFPNPPKAGSTIYIEFSYYKKAGDHVWVEVWSENRWIHVDPTEQVIDKPKMYVIDWGKEVNNVVAITKDDSGNVVTIDVTKDYQ
jgi:hypothetical protein